MRLATVSIGLLLASAMLSGDQRGNAPKLDPAKFLTQPLIADLYTADPSAHVFNGKIFIYPSHDIDAGVPADERHLMLAGNAVRFFHLDE